MAISSRSMNDVRSDPSAAAERLVWDLPIRISHWALAACVAGAWITQYAGTEWFPWHRRLGYATLVLVAFRVAWGFVGPRHARFAVFLRGPRVVLDYLRGRERGATAGHNPLGALSVVAMLAVLLVQAVTGLFANDEIANAGPFFGWISQETSNRVTGVHEANSNVLLALVALHLLAIAWYALRLRRPIVRAMWTGRKDAADVPEGEAIAGSRTALALAIVALLAVALALAVRAAPEATIALY
ncbi:MAG: cytochrome B [Gammaproteobacteria bacterium]|nr:cytochrome B [Gammaproteobacteria bacterium]